MYGLDLCGESSRWIKVVIYSEITETSSSSPDHGELNDASGSSRDILRDIFFIEICVFLYVRHPAPKTAGFILGLVGKILSALPLWSLSRRISYSICSHSALPPTPPSCLVAEYIWRHPPALLCSSYSTIYIFSSAKMFFKSKLSVSDLQRGNLSL